MSMPRFPLTDKDRQKMYELRYKEQLSWSVIGQRFNISQTRACNIVTEYKKKYGL